MRYPTSPSVDEILKGKLYIGNLPAAKSQETLESLGVTHILSVCPEFSSTGPNHLNISVDDCEYDDLLIHLPEACQFIQRALEEDGRVLVHCIFGVSRSATVAAAYLMESRQWTSTHALNFIRKRRPCIQPNYGFLKQLDAFADCHYSPSASNPAYISWKRQQGQKVTAFLNQMVDTVAIIPNQLFLSSEFPADAQQAESLTIELGISHLVSISPSQIPRLPATIKHLHADPSQQDDLLVAIPNICNFIREAVTEKGQVLVYSEVECKAAIVVCCYLMCAQNVSLNEARKILEKALPLFHRTANFNRHLELFDACEFAPTSDHPLVRDWVSKCGPSGPLNGSYSREMAAAITATAMASVLSETSVDIGAFGEALKKIQRSGTKGANIPAAIQAV
ncbi:phosphatases II [Dendrothele bispora CBS 962.96]|uniref:protein-tyrosine-phosphatase n=1 Tax=Dendrothele bispora (strain CBS 962.96) TaxID=1314807 RepID=A0A4V4HIU6_DENBC|nr:phosphatases II [Dendrothele bispora CBS 962.96]